jgi:hypothetical protein
VSKNDNASLKSSSFRVSKINLIFNTIVNQNFRLYFFLEEERIAFNEITGQKAFENENLNYSRILIVK